MKFERLYRSSQVSVTAICCRPQSACLGETEPSPYASVVFVRRGAFRLHFDDEVQVADPSRAILFRADEEYRVDHPLNCGDDTVEFRLAACWLDEVAWTAGTAQGSRVRTLAPETALMQARLLRRLVNGETTGLEVEETGVRLTSAVFNDGQLLPPAIGRRGSEARRRRIVQNAQLLMLADLGRDWTLEAVGAEVGASPHHLTRLFRRQTGEPLHRFLVRARLATALTRLLDGDVDLTTLALELGFSSHSHFSAAFSRVYGTPPSYAVSAARQP